MKRRDFLKQSALGAAGLTVSLSGGPVVLGFAPPKQPASAPGPDPVLVVIYLRGGHDQLNTVVPFSDPTYYKIRPNVAIPGDAVLKLNDQFGLHPAMAPLKPFYDQERFSLVINSGSPHTTRSHFDAQDFMEYAAPGNRTIRDGWLNRYLQTTADQRGY